MSTLCNLSSSPFSLLVAKAYAAAVAAGREIMAVYDVGEAGWEVTHKADNSPLTLADRRAHEVIVRHLSDTDIYILSEEGLHAPYAERSRHERLWVVDPLDGTKEFIRRTAEFTVNIALVSAGRPLFGVVYAPATGQMFVGGAALGGAWAARLSADDGQPDLMWFQTSARSLPFDSSSSRVSGEKVVVASRSHLSPETEAFVEDYRRRYGAVRLVSAGSSLKLCLVASGEADAYPRLAPTMEWDTAAGQAVAEGAGARVLSHPEGLPLIYNKPDLHNPWFIVDRER